MEIEAGHLTPDPEGEHILEISALREDVESLERRVKGTIGATLAITVLFVVSGVFMEQSSTLWFLGALWLFFTSRLVGINRTSARELRSKEAALGSLASPPQDTFLPEP